MIDEGISSGLFPIATRRMMPAITAWKMISGMMPIAYVAYSGTAAKLVRRSVSISRRLGVIAPPRGEDHRMAIGRNHDRLIRRLDERQRAHQLGHVIVLRMQRHARQRERHLQPALRRAIDERRGRADQ